MKLKSKILCIGLVGSLIAITLAVITMVFGNIQKHYREQEAKFRLLQAEIADARNAHLVWLRTIDDTLIADQPELKIGTDGKLCNFGKWYYAEGEAMIQNMPQDLQDKYRAVNDIHLLVHTQGGKLIAMWDPADPQPSYQFYMKEIVPIAEKLIGQLKEIEESAVKHREEIAAEGAWYLANQNTPTIVTAVIGIVAMLIFCYVIAQGIVRALHESGDILDEIAVEGVLTADIPEKLQNRKDEIGDLGRNIRLIIEDYRTISDAMEQLSNGNWTISINTKSDRDRMNQSFASMIRQVNDALTEINESVRQVNTGAGEVTAAATTLSSGAQESAASLEEITASMSEISGQTKANAQNASEARNHAQKAADVATDGQNAMKRMNESMERIMLNSGEIQRVIKVIDDIAFQTNLLALNAAVEAARAGAHGKGFAVVAEEVRNLAARSAKAAQETTELISKSGQEINQGGEVAAQTAEVLNAIVDQIKKTTDLVAGIAVASNEQAQGVTQITVGLQQIDAVTQQNTAAAEESAGAASEMSGMSTNLHNLLARFKLQAS